MRPVLPAAFLSTAAAAAALFIAAHHPLGPGLATVLVLAWGALNFARPTAWLALLPALLPVASLAPWSGWVALEEFDLLVLGTVAGVYARQALDLARGRAEAARPPPAGVRALAAALGLWTLAALWRGLLDAPGAPGWFDAFLQPLNAWRLAKSALWVLLLLPALHEALQAAPARALRRLRLGMLAGTALFLAAVLWERAAYAGLLQFSSSYRTTGPFWEMNVGGAAIDAYVALAMPFTAWALWRLRRPLPWCLAALMAVALIYAALTTFSRGVYGAVALPLLLPLAWRVLSRLRQGRLRGLLQAGALTAAAVLLLVGVSQALELKGVAATLAVWLLAALAVWRFTRIGWRAAAGVTLTVTLVAEVVVVFSGGSFMRERLNASGMDLQARLEHWGRGLSLLRSDADLALGLGAGRLPAHYASAKGHPGFSGTAQWELDESVRLTGRQPGAHPRGYYGLTQRVAAHPGPHRVELRVRAEVPSWVLLKVCESWLLYDLRCQIRQLRVVPTSMDAQLVTVLRFPPLGGAPLPRMHVFMVAARTGALHVDEMRLYAGGEQLLRNGDFSDGLAHWWPTAQEYYTPWHIDNLYLELLIERGVPGLALFLALVAAALWRLARVVRAGGALAESGVFLGAALCGGLLVGLISGVMDMPRVAWLLWLLPWTALLLPLQREEGRKAG